MAQLLDDEDPAAGRDEDVPSTAAKPAETAMFDEAESDAAGLDIDDADVVDAALEPPEIDIPTGSVSGPSVAKLDYGATRPGQLVDLYT